MVFGAKKDHSHPSPKTVYFWAYWTQHLCCGSRPSLWSGSRMLVWLKYSRATRYNISLCIRVCVVVVVVGFWTEYCSVFYFRRNSKKMAVWWWGWRCGRPQGIFLTKVFLRPSSSLPIISSKGYPQPICAAYLGWVLHGFVFYLKMTSW